MWKTSVPSTVCGSAGFGKRGYSVCEYGYGEEWQRGGGERGGGDALGALRCVRPGFILRSQPFMKERREEESSVVGCNVGHFSTHDLYSGPWTRAFGQLNLAQPSVAKLNAAITHLTDNSVVGATFGRIRRPSTVSGSPYARHDACQPFIVFRRCMADSIVQVVLVAFTNASGNGHERE
jgi:hypothetical protein